MELQATLRRRLPPRVFVSVRYRVTRASGETPGGGVVFAVPPLPLVIGFLLFL